MAEHKKPKFHWLLLVGSLALISLACRMSAGEDKEEKNEVIVKDKVGISEVIEKTEEFPDESELEIEITEEPESGIGSTKMSEPDGMEMVYVPAGEFSMGLSDSDIEFVIEEFCEECEFGWFRDEQPQHTVYLDAYWIDKTEVTNALFEKFVEDSGYQTNAEREGWGYAFNGESLEEKEGATWRHPQGAASSIEGMEEYPVVQVSWNDASAYCEWAGKRLPSEAEWEKAAHGTDGRIYPWGNDVPSGELLNFADLSLNVSWIGEIEEDDGYQLTAPVGSYPAGASQYGALDMSGNVWEWVNDWLDEYYYELSPTNNPQGPSIGEYRVSRGGSWYNQIIHAHSAYRGRGIPDSREDDRGFRCVLSAETQE